MRRSGWGGRQLPTLFKMGAVGGLTDGELLGRFATRDGEAAERAFEALVERHGPMVLRVCRSILRDEHAAEDALQATFLVLVRRAGTISKQDSIGNWLYGVALRVSSCARGASARRRKHEKQAAVQAPAGPRDGPDEFDLAGVIHEELRRLPERYRAVIVLCHLEGATCEEAAGRLRWPVGTVKSRLARGRKRLRDRLARRGLAPSVGALGMTLGGEASPAALPSRLVESTARIALLLVEGQAATLGTIPASVAALTRRTVTLMMMKNLAFSMAIVLGLAAASAGISSFARGTPDDPPKKPQAAPKGEGEKGSRVRPEPILENALRTADQITEPWLKAYALGQIAAAQAHLGQRGPSRATFQRVAEIIEHDGDDPRRRSTGLSRLARAQAMAGDLDAARATAAQVLEWSLKIEDDHTRLSHLQVSAMSQAKAGDVPGALLLFGGLDDAPAWLRAFVLSEIAGEQAKEGDLPGARETMTSATAEAKRAEDHVKELEAHPERTEKGPPGREDDSPSAHHARQVVELRYGLQVMRQTQIRGLAPLAEAEASKGQNEAARAWLKQARAAADELDEDMRPAPLAQIAMAQKKVGDQDAAEATLALAVETARKLRAPNQRPVGLARVAIEQVGAGDRAGAQKTLERVVQMAETDQGESILAQHLLAGVLPKVGDWENAWKTALNIDSEFIRANSVQGVAFEQARAGEPREALDWAEDQSDTLLRAHALLGVVRGIIEREAQYSGK